MRMLPALLVALLTVLLAVGCSGPCQELDQNCETCPSSEIKECKFCLRRYSNQFCDQVLRDTSGCPYAQLTPGCS
jgi:hypothetical protein